jgi:uncharacterized protein (DUF1015 family)
MRLKVLDLKNINLVESIKPKKKGDFALYFSQKKKWIRLTKTQTYNNVYDDLDVQYVTNKIIEKILEITDFTNNEYVEYYPGGKYPLKWYKGKQMHFEV